MATLRCNGALHRQVDEAHPPAADLAQDFIRSDAKASDRVPIDAHPPIPGGGPAELRLLLSCLGTRLHLGIFRADRRRGIAQTLLQTGKDGVVFILILVIALQEVEGLHATRARSERCSAILEESCSESCPRSNCRRSSSSGHSWTSPAVA